MRDDRLRAAPADRGRKDPQIVAGVILPTSSHFIMIMSFTWYTVPATQTRPKESSMGSDLMEAPLNIAADSTQFLRERLKYHITRYKHKKTYCGLMASMSKFFALLLGSSVTLLLGLKTSDAFRVFDAGMGAAALILSAVLTIVTGWEAFAVIHGDRFVTELHCPPCTTLGMI
jgi:hypothetical protein